MKQETGLAPAGKERHEKGYATHLNSRIGRGRPLCVFAWEVDFGCAGEGEGLGNVLLCLGVENGSLPMESFEEKDVFFFFQGDWELICYIFSFAVEKGHEIWWGFFPA